MIIYSTISHFPKVRFAVQYQNSQDIVSTTDLVALIEEFGIPLKRQGREHVGLCPFHDEKTPSFFVNPQKQVYLCRGCGAKGNVVTFAADFRGTTNDAALSWLADRAGITLPQNSEGERIVRKVSYKPFFDVLQSAATVFNGFLSQTNQLDQYLISRGITDELIADFTLGYAPPSYDIIESVVSASGYTIDSVKAILKDCGLIKANDRPAFVDRLMFPISNEKGQICAFAGRALSEQSGPGKYINSIESPIFRKRDTLYGLAPAGELTLTSRKRWNHIQAQQTVYVVEGYTDVLTLYRHGIRSVAQMGTAFTIGHFHTLRNKHISELTFCFDGDDAGRNAATKLIDPLILLAKNEQIISFVQLPEGQDPDTFVSAEGLKGIQSQPTKTLSQAWVDLNVLQACGSALKSPEATVLAHSALDKIAGEMTSRMLSIELRARIEALVGPHPFGEFVLDAPRNEQIHPAISRLISAVLSNPDLMSEFTLPKSKWAEQRISRPETVLVGLNLLLKAQQLTYKSARSDKWDFIIQLTDGGYPSSWANVLLVIATKKASPITQDDAKALWKSCLTFAEIQSSIGIIWPLSK